MQAKVITALAGRDAPGLTEALLDQLADTNEPVRSAAVDALAGRDTPKVTQALLDRLSDPPRLVRWVARKGLAEHGAPEVLMYLAKEIGKLMSLADETAQVPDPPFLERAEELMTQFYRRIGPSEQPAVLNAMGWLTRLRW